MRKTYIPRTYTKKKSPPRKVNPFISILQFLIWIIFLGGIGYLLYSPLLNITNIDIRVDNEILQKDIKSKSDDLIGTHNYWYYNNKNIFLVRSDILEKELSKEFPQIKSITIKRTINRSLEMTIQLRTPLFSICENTICSHISDDGINIGNDSLLASLTVLTGISSKSRGETVMSKREIQWFKTISEIYNQIDGVKVSSIAIQQKAENKILGVFVYTEQGYYIMLDLDTNIIYQAGALKQVFISQIPPAQRPNLQYIDLRIKDRVYYKFK
jgi:cell division septal protein FtsQ